MLYHLHDICHAFLGPMAQLAHHHAARLGDLPPACYTPATRHAQAGCELAHRLGKRYERPGFGIGQETIVAARPFCRLLQFRKEDPCVPAQPPVLLVAPLSGHHASLLRETARELSRDHDVYITDWLDARLVPLDAGEFGLDDYVRYLRDSLAILPPGLHVVAVCQATVPVLGALALTASAAGALPRSLTLISGPVDTRRAPTAVNRFATSHSLAWFRAAMIYPVPPGHAGAGRRVYPGFIQHACFVAMNAARHLASHADYYEQRCRGEDAARHCAFYDDYNATLDLPEAFYLDTVQTVFQECRLARGDWVVDGQAVRPQDIEGMALLTVEGERDDITAPGQTAAALDLCSGIAPECKRSLLAPACGHYGTFSGRHWQDSICPAIGAFIAQAEHRFSDPIRTHAVALQVA